MRWKCGKCGYITPNNPGMGKCPLCIRSLVWIRLTDEESMSRSFKVWRDELIRLCERWYVEYPAEDWADHLRTECEIASMLVADMDVETKFGIISVKKNPDCSVTMSDTDCINSLFDRNTELYIERDKLRRAVRFLQGLLVISFLANVAFIVGRILSCL